MGVVNLTLKSTHIAIMKHASTGTHAPGYRFGQDAGTEHSTIFSVSCHSENSGHSAVIKVRFYEDGPSHSFTLFSGDTLYGPFSNVEIDSFSNTSANNMSCFIYHQPH